MVDLQARTLERVTHSLAGGDIDAAVLDGPTISADGGRVAFASFAGNLFFGDANQRADAFVASRLPDLGAEPAARDITGGAGSTIEFDREGPRIGLRAKPRAGGKIVLTVSVPGAGWRQGGRRGRSRQAAQAAHPGHRRPAPGGTRAARCASCCDR